MFSLNMVNTLGPYVTAYYVFGGDLKAASIMGGLMGTVYGVTSFIVPAPLSALAKKLGKEKALMIALGCAILGSVAKWFCFNPQHPALMIIVQMLLAPGMTGIWMLAEAMVADVCDFERQKHGQRMEAVYGAVYAWTLKSGLALGVLIAGILVMVSGFEVGLGSSQKSETLLRLRLMFSFLPIVGIAISIAVLRRYNLTEAMLKKQGHAPTYSTDPK